MTIASETLAIARAVDEAVMQLYDRMDVDGFWVEHAGKQVRVTKAEVISCRFRELFASTTLAKTISQFRSVIMPKFRPG